MSEAQPTEAAGAAVREVREETGVEVRVDEYVGSYSLADSALIAHLFRCTLLAGTPALPDTGEIADLARWPVDGLPTPKTNLLHHGMPDALARRTAVERSGLPRIT